MKAEDVREGALVKVNDVYMVVGEIDKFKGTMKPWIYFDSETNIVKLNNEVRWNSNNVTFVNNFRRGFLARIVSDTLYASLSNRYPGYKVDVMINSLILGPFFGNEGQPMTGVYVMSLRSEKETVHIYATRNGFYERKIKM